MRKPRELSGGQRQRVALGRALVRKPRVFLMDEPLSNLDARLRVEMRAELKLLHRRLGITTVYVTHDQGEALGLSDRLAVLDRGEIEQCDRPEEVYRRPANVFVAGFIGSPPMNILHCTTGKTAILEGQCSGLTIDAAGRQDLPDRVLVGIRPEDARITLTRRDGSVEVTVSVIEPAGSFDWVDVLSSEARVRCIAGAEERIRSGDRAYLTVNRNRLSFFDPETGKRL